VISREVINVCMSPGRALIVCKSISNELCPYNSEYL